MGDEPRVVVAHDYFTQRGGAERVALAIRAALPGRQLLTAVYDPATTFPEVQRWDVRTSRLQALPLLRRDPRRALPFLPQAFDSLGVDDADVVVCSSTGFAHGVRTDAPKLVYCHNPPRWLYQPEDYLSDRSPVVRAALRLLTPRLTRWDQAAARSADRYLVNSTAVRDRVRRVYGIDATVLAPPVLIDADGPQDPVRGIEPGFFLVVGRPRGYKNVEVACEAFTELPGERLVVVGGLPAGDWPDRFTGVQGLSDAQLRWLYASCAATISVAHEDFGLTPLEGNAFGKPALCLKAGGFLDTLTKGRNGWYIEELTPSAVRGAVHRLQRNPLDEHDVRTHAAAYSPQVFADGIRQHVADLQ